MCKYRGPNEQDSNKVCWNYQALFSEMPCRKDWSIVCPSRDNSLPKGAAIFGEIIK